MITTGLLFELYEKAKINYELAEHDWQLTDNIDYLKEMCIHSGEMQAYRYLLDHIN